ncbi:glycosyltransferase [Nostoc sp. 'Peltigera membranacea cyanobiont' 213]|uniref:glycosyltransferase n=2 Tax=unclassified Nostoc TaxID=2593658 RepID=UPI001CB97C86|nr:glycosyltransferase [Nostoc sp. 'Peltigera membranacea cyanobiont' 213]
MSQDNKSSIFIITGMHRSGTSLSASLMESAGVNIGERLMGASPNNPKGHFENLDFVGFHERALRCQGISQEGWTIQKGIDIPQQLFDKAKLIIAENATLNSWGWKDPRTTLFLDFWKNLLPQAYFIFTYRAPWEVIDSLYRRGDEIFYSNPKYALQIWMHYNKIILDFHHQFPDKCILLNTHTVIADYTVISKLCENKFGLKLKDPSEGIVDKSLMTNLASNAHRQMLIKRFFPEAMELYSELNDRADLKCQLVHLDPLEVDIYFRDWVLQDWLDIYKIRKDSKIELERLQSTLQHTQTELERSQSTLQHTQTELERSQSTLQHTQAELERSQSNLQHTQTELERSQSTLQYTQAELERSQSTLQYTQTELERSQSNLQYTQTELNHSQSTLQYTQTELNHSHCTIAAMNTSKFWQMRKIWFKLRHAVGLLDDGNPFHISLWFKFRGATTINLVSNSSSSNISILSRLKNLWTVFRTKGLGYCLKKLLKKTSSNLKFDEALLPTIVLPDIPQTNDVNYQKWLNQNYPNQEALQKMGETAKLLDYKPTLSLIMPVFNTPTHFLQEAIESVLNQVYPYWELCIADDSSTDNYVRETLEEYSSKDSRIKVVFRTENGHISRCSNSAIEIATGDFIALLDHDDLLTPDALYEIALLLNKHPEADMIYSDEDKIDETGKLRDPFFKPDWCPDSFLSRMYTCHLGTYRRALVNAVGGFRTGYEGSQDYDLVLRLTEKTTQIFHIPKILYHWRIHPQSAASKPDQKPYAVIAAEKALVDALARRGEHGRVTQAGNLVGHYIIRYTIKDYKLVSIIIPTRDLGNTLDKCLTSIFEKTTYPNYEVILIDNGSQEENTANVISKWQQKESSKFKCYRLDIPFNYSKINNYAVNKAKGDYLLFLNNDIEVITPDWIDAMVEQAQRPSIGTVGALLLYPDNTIQHAGVVMGIGGVANHSHKHYPVNSPGYFGQILTVNNYLAVTAACLMCRREIFELIGGFEEELAVAFNDVDLCLKIVEKGYKNIYLPHVMLYHYESKSRGCEDTPAKVARFIQETTYMQKKWKNFIEYDPCYSINLTFKREDYSINA